MFLTRMLAPTDMFGEPSALVGPAAAMTPVAAAMTPDANGADTFSLLSFWRANEDEVPAFSYVLRAVLANAPNSIPPERVFSVLNDTFDDDQGNSLADYIELCLQLQFNSRTR